MYFFFRKARDQNTWSEFSSVVFSAFPHGSEPQSAFCADFSAQLETNINTVLCAVQSLVKRRERQQPDEQQREDVSKGESAFVHSSAWELLINIRYIPAVVKLRPAGPGMAHQAFLSDPLDLLIWPVLVPSCQSCSEDWFQYDSFPECNAPTAFSGDATRWWQTQFDPFL